MQTLDRMLATVPLLLAWALVGLIALYAALAVVNLTAPVDFDELIGAGNVAAGLAAAGLALAVALVIAAAIVGVALTR
jgi:uncharacterized membrane protein YjfL (UPF0719 family)